MVAVRINGEDSSIRGDGLPRVSDLIELIKASIDPDHMITGIRINGRDLEDTEWEASPTQMGTAIIEIDTGTQEDFVRDRMTYASEVVKSCFVEFRDSRKHFQDGDMQGGNARLAGAVNTLKAFFEWYGTILELVPADQKKTYDINEQVSAIAETCKRICQQQLYQSWWALSESLEKDLEPKLDQLEDFCRKAVRSN